MLYNTLMDTLGRIFIDSQVYYSADAIMTKARAFKGTARNAREMIRKRDVPSDAYIYARQAKEGESYVKTTGSASQDRVYVTEAFAMTIPELNPQAARESIDASGEQQRKNNHGILLNLRTMRNSATTTVN